MAEYQSGSGKTPPMHSTARLVREQDMMRTGIESDLVEISGESLTIRTKEQLAINDAVKIQLLNPVQRAQKETRGVVREIRKDADGSTIVTIELFTRLTALEASLYKMGIRPSDADSKPKWV
jgi:hypothetical protein